MDIAGPFFHFAIAQVFFLVDFLNSELFGDCAFLNEQIFQRFLKGYFFVIHKFLVLKGINHKALGT
ncbi:hypothetical protein D9M69_729450 [compost metagenome]